jgi:hypothetical protein
VDLPRSSAESTAGYAAKCERRGARKSGRNVINVVVPQAAAALDLVRPQAPAERHSNTHSDADAEMGSRRRISDQHEASPGVAEHEAVKAVGGWRATFRCGVDPRPEKMGAWRT